MNPLHLLAMIAGAWLVFAGPHAALGLIHAAAAAAFTVIAAATAALAVLVVRRIAADLSFYPEASP